jgi:hypothetical protein
MRRWWGSHLVLPSTTETTEKDARWQPVSLEFGGSAGSRWWCSGIVKGFYGGGRPWWTSWGGWFSTRGGGSRTMRWRCGKEARVSCLASKIWSKTCAIYRAFCSKISHMSMTLSPSHLIWSRVRFCLDSSVRDNPPFLLNPVQFFLHRSHAREEKSGAVMTWAWGHRSGRLWAARRWWSMTAGGRGNDGQVKCRLARFRIWHSSWAALGLWDAQCEIGLVLG